MKGEKASKQAVMTSDSGKVWRREAVSTQSMNNPTLNNQTFFDLNCDITLFQGECFDNKVRIIVRDNEVIEISRFNTSFIEDIYT